LRVKRLIAGVTGASATAGFIQPQRYKSDTADTVPRL